MSQEKMNPGFFKGVKRMRACVPSLVEQQDDPSKLGLADVQKFNLCITFLTMLDDSVKLTLKMQWKGKKKEEEKKIGGKEKKRKRKII